MDIVNYLFFSSTSVLEQAKYNATAATQESVLSLRSETWSSLSSIEDEDLVTAAITKPVQDIPEEDSKDNLLHGSPISIVFQRQLSASLPNLAENPLESLYEESSILQSSAILPDIVVSNPGEQEKDIWDLEQIHGGGEGKENN